MAGAAIEPGAPHGPLPAAVHAMACMEIWGGNGAIENAVSAPGIDAWVYSRPYRGAARGGDIHYVSMCNAGKVARFVVADVSGHGEQVAEAALTLRGMVRRSINTPDQTRLTRELNEAFLSDQSGGLFATALLATYLSPTDQLIVCNAGHPRPLWWRAADKRWIVLRAEDESHVSADASDLPLGIIEPTEYSQFAVELGKGDLVLIVTDGVLESTDASGAQLGEQGLIELLGSLEAGRPERIVPELLAALDARSTGAAANDDVTVVLLHHNASDPPRYSLGEQALALAKTLRLIKV